MAEEQFDEGLYPIGTVSEITGVNAVTLRAWERRYGLIKPERTPKGHRLYSKTDVDKIQHILEQLGRGIAMLNRHYPKLKLMSGRSIRHA
jgi:predicted site-specific integrase-resolvase